MAFEVEISETAEADIEEGADFIPRESPSAAERWHVDLWELIFSLREMPKRFAIIPEADELEFPYRSAKHYSHRVIYGID
jgi:plasmid stabilization system protein ParE